MRSFLVGALVLGACDAGTASAERKDAPLHRWPVGGELVPRSQQGQFWIYGDGCLVHQLDLSSSHLDAVAAPPGCRDAAVLEEGIAYRLDDGHWRVPASTNVSGLELDGGDVIFARDYVLHHRDHELTAITGSNSRSWTLPVSTRIEARAHAGARGLYTAFTTRMDDNPRAPHPSEPYQYATTTIIDHEPPSSSLRLRWVGLYGGSVDGDARLEMPAGARLAAFDWATVALVTADRSVQVYRDHFEAPTWSFRATGDVVSVMLTTRFVFVDARVASGLHEVHALDPQTGAPMWTRRVQAERLRLFPDNAKIVLARDNVLAQIDAGTGAELWTWQLPKPPTSLLRVKEDTWLASDPSGTELFEISADSR